MVARVNNDPHSSWKAEMSPRFSGVTKRQALRMLGVRAPASVGKDISCPVNTSITAQGLPDSFDARTQWPEYIHPVRDQGSCGSCWAFSASEVLSDRLAIATDGKMNAVLSPMALVNCDTEVLRALLGLP
jgi:cathepsin B